MNQPGPHFFSRPPVVVTNNRLSPRFFRPNGSQRPDPGVSPTGRPTQAKGVGSRHHN